MIIEPEDIKEYFPNIDILFIEEELPLLIKQLSIADTAAEIIVNRINRCIPTNITSSRTLQNILNAVPIFFAE